MKSERFFSRPFLFYSVTSYRAINKLVTPKRRQAKLLAKLFLILLFTLAGTKKAIAEYEQTKWGMAPQAVEQLYPGGLLVKDINGQVSYNVVKPVANYNYSFLKFKFSNEGLEQVQIDPRLINDLISLELGPNLLKKADVESNFEDIKNKLREKYGKEGGVSRDKKGLYWKPNPELFILLQKEYVGKEGSIRVTYSKPPTVDDLERQRLKGL